MDVLHGLYMVSKRARDHAYQPPLHCAVDINWECRVVSNTQCSGAAPLDRERPDQAGQSGIGRSGTAEVGSAEVGLGRCGTAEVG